MTVFPVEAHAAASTTVVTSSGVRLDMPVTGTGDTSTSCDPVRDEIVQVLADARAQSHISHPPTTVGAKHDGHLPASVSASLRDG